MFDKIDTLRKAPEPAKERFVAFVTIAAVVVITLVWFVFSVPSFFKKANFNFAPAATSTPAASADATTTPALQAPFSS